MLTMSYSPTTCTVVVAGDGARCGQPVVSTFTSKRDGTVYGECAEHCACPHEAPAHTPPAHPPTRTTKPFVLVAAGAIVGYAESKSPAVLRRAARLGAQVVAVQR